MQITIIGTEAQKEITISMMTGLQIEISTSSINIDTISSASSTEESRLMTRVGTRLLQRMLQSMLLTE
jgi:hypothetical protein